MTLMTVKTAVMVELRRQDEHDREFDPVPFVYDANPTFGSNLHTLDDACKSSQAKVDRICKADMQVKAQQGIMAAPPVCDLHIYI